MSAVADFLLARIAEDESAAKQAWDATGDPIIDLANAAAAHAIHPLLYVHAAEWAPRRVLPECASKLRIVELHDGMHHCPAAPGSVYLSSRPCDTLLLLASPYAGHLDYLEEWRV